MVTCAGSQRSPVLRSERNTRRPLVGGNLCPIYISSYVTPGSGMLNSVWLPCPALPCPALVASETLNIFIFRIGLC